MSRFDYQRLVLGKLFQILHDEAILHPVLANLSGFSVSDQFVGIKGDIEAEVVVDHHLKGFSLDAASAIFVDGFRFQIACGTEAVSVDPPARA